MKPNRQGRDTPGNATADFKKLAEQKSPGIAAEFLDFILHNKKWWLIPIIVVLLLLGLIALLSGTGAAPFIYTLF